MGLESEMYCLIIHFAVAHLSIPILLSELRPLLSITWDILISFNWSPHLRPLSDSVHFSHIARLNTLRHICVHGSSRLKYSRGFTFLQLEILKLNRLFWNTDTNLSAHQYYLVFQRPHFWDKPIAIVQSLFH